MIPMDIWVMQYLKPEVEVSTKRLERKPVVEAKPPEDPEPEPEPQPAPEPEPAPVIAQSPVTQVIQDVFGPYGMEALAVARCESTFDVNAVNGQYLGLFQMGEWERANYGHGDTAFEQAVAAERYFIATGSDWSPWACQP